MRYKLRAVVNSSIELDAEKISMKGSTISYITVACNVCRTCLDLANPLVEYKHNATHTAEIHASRKKLKMFIFVEH
jgi:hypothetical protein